MRIVSPFQSPYFANVYIIGEEGEPCVVVDPGNNQNGCLDRYIDKHHNGVVLGYLLTHGHYDHIFGLLELTHKAPLYIHEEDVRCLRDDRYNLLPNLKIEGYEIHAVADKEIIKLGQYEFEVIFTPFHTAGSVCYYLKEANALFSGDTLFHLSIGRTDLAGGNPRLIESSLSKLIPLPDTTKVYPGHEGTTDMGTEKRLNPYLSRQ